MYLTFTIILLLLGVSLLFAEMFVLPGFGVAGVFGFLSLAGSVTIAYWKLNILWPWAGHVTLGASILLSVIAIVVFAKSKVVDKMALETKVEGSVEMPSAGKRMEDMKNNS